MWTLRYTSTAPIVPRPHAPCEPMFKTMTEAVDWLDQQPNMDLLEVVQRSTPGNSPSDKREG